MKIHASTALVLLILIIAPVQAYGLTSLLSQARTGSHEAMILELQRQRTNTELSLMDVTPDIAYRVDNLSRVGTLVGPGGEQFIITANPSVTFTLPDEYRTEIQTGFREIEFTRRLDPAPVVDIWTVTPFVKAVQPLRHFFEDDTALDDISYSIAYLQGERSYRQGMLGIDMQVLGLLKLINTLDRQIAALSYNKNVLEETYRRDLEQMRYVADSSQGRTMQRQIAELEMTAASAQAQRNMQVRELERLTGSPYEGMPFIPPVTPRIAEANLGNTAMLIKGLERDRAEEQLASYMKDVWNIRVEGGYGVGIVTTNGTRDYGHQMEAGVSGIFKDVTFSAGITGQIANPNTVMGYIQGSWSQDGKSRERTLTAQSLEQAAALAQQAYLREQRQFQNNLLSLELDIRAWQREESYLEMQIVHAQKSSQTAEAAFLQGIGREQAVEDAKHALEQLRYDEIGHRINAWMLQREIDQALL